MNKYIRLLLFKLNKKIKKPSAFKIKLEKVLNDHVYRQAPIGFLASFICATIVVLTALKTETNIIAITWYLIFILFIFLRLLLIKYYHKGNKENIVKWRRLFIFSAFTTGALWGFTGVFLTSIHNSTYLTFIVLILGGITAASIPLFAGILNAAFAFQILAILPTAIHLALMQDTLYKLLSIMMGAYLIVLMLMSARQYKMIKKAIRLQFENSELLKNQKILIKKLEQMATHDDLTKLSNRSLFAPLMLQAIERSHRNNKIIALLYLDIDNFKKVNDYYGHHIGDIVLIEIANRLEKLSRSSDILFRLGGDEFAIIVENISDVKGIATISERLLKNLGGKITIDDVKIRPTVSIGISLYPFDEIKVDELLKKADTAMYFAKEQGGNQFYFASDLNK